MASAGFVSSRMTVALLQDKLLSMMVSNAVLWPLSRWVNEKLVPEKHRSMSTKIVRVSSLWGCAAWLPCLHCLMCLVPAKHLAMYLKVLHFRSVRSPAHCSCCPELLATA